MSRPKLPAVTARGGPGRGQGRKPIADTPTKHYTVTLDDLTAETVRDYGEGNLSAGIRKASKALDRIASQCPCCGQPVKKGVEK